MKVIISVANPEHVKVPPFASIIMDQFKLDADFDEDRIVQYILSKDENDEDGEEEGAPDGSATSSRCVIEGSFESDIAHSPPQIVSPPSEEYLSEFVLRNAVDAMTFFHCYEDQFMHFFSLHGTDVVMKAEALLGSHTHIRPRHRIPDCFRLSSHAKSNIEFVEQYLKAFPSKLHHPMQRVFHDTSLGQYQRLVNIESRVMSCIRAHYSYKQHKGEEDPLSSELNISIRMKPPMGPNGIRYYDTI